MAEWKSERGLLTRREGDQVAQVRMVQGGWDARVWTEQEGKIKASRSMGTFGSRSEAIEWADKQLE